MADKAVLAGINDYRTISDLRGCINDLDNMADVLVNTFEFPQENIEKLRDREVTKSNVMDAWDWLLRDARPGDRLVFHFSGHGSYTVDDDGDERDGADELLCLFDMDWGDRDSYLLDDDLRRLTERLPGGVRMTVVLDCCHSGTGTRMLLSPTDARSLGREPAKMPIVDLETTLARLRETDSSHSRGIDVVDEILSPRDLRDTERAVLARFVEPPYYIRARLNSQGVRSSFRQAATRSRSAEMNHVLLAGSQSDQTSADAYIDNSYNGAFTFYLCETIRRVGNGLSHQNAIKEIRRQLQRQGFLQNPQLEPDSATGVLFEGVEHKGRADTHEHEVPTAAGIERLNQSIERLLDVLGEKEGRIGPRARRSGQRALVYVHGICRHDPGFSEPWWRAMRSYLSADLRRELGDHRHEVLWSDLVTSSRAAVAGIRPEEQLEQQLLSAELEAVLRDRAELAELPSEPAQRSAGEPREVAGERAFLGVPGLDCADDFVKYLVSDRVRGEVIQRFERVVVPLLGSGFDIDIISHSWGTVIAYEALWTLAGNTFPGRARTLFTVGSALSIGPVKSRLRPSSGGRPPLLDRWVNLDAKGDIVGGPLRGRPFAVDHEFVNLAAVGCSNLLGAVSPACAHSSYFDDGNEVTNRHIFAKYIND